MKVAMFTDTFLPNKDGVVTSICNTAKGLKKKGIEVVIFAPGEKTKLETHCGAKVYFIKGKEFKNYPGYKIVLPDKFLSRLLAFLEIENPDIYHVHSPFSLGIGGLLFSIKFKKPVIGTFHTNLNEYIGYIRNGNITKVEKEIFGAINWKFLKFFFNQCNKTIAPTKEIAKILREKGFKNLIVIPSSVDFSFLDSQRKIDIRKKHKLKKSTKVILYVGRLGFEKKLKVLLDAFKMLEGEFHLLIVGKGPFEKEYKVYAKKNQIKNVTFAGYVSDEELPSYYQACDLFVSPSDTETQGLTFIEAMHFGKPVIGANKYGVKEIIKNYKNGLKFEPDNSHDLKRRIEIIFSNKELYKKLSKNAKIMSNIYSIEKTTFHLLKEYQKLKYRKRTLDTLNKRFKNILNFDKFVLR